MSPSRILSAISLPPRKPSLVNRARSWTDGRPAGNTPVTLRSGLISSGLAKYATRATLERHIVGSQSSPPLVLLFHHSAPGDPEKTRMRFGVLLAPHRPVGEHPMLQFRRDLVLVEHLDR